MARELVTEQGIRRGRLAAIADGAQQSLSAAGDCA
jgi:hypothetical protein